MRTAILGAGVSGLAAAHALSKLPGEDFRVFEQASAPGGLCRVIEKDGFRFDVVSHVLHFRSERARRLVYELLGDDLISVARSSWIYFRGRYIPYPFQSHLGYLPWPEKLQCVSGYWRAWVHRQLNGNVLPDNFEDWVYYHFGSGIARHFMIPYNTELWGLSPREMSLDWVRPFVPQSSLRETMKGLIANRTARVGYNTVFLYPVRGGMQALVDALAASVPKIELNRQAVEIDLSRKTVRFADGGMETYERLISTMPLDTLVRLARGLPDNLRGVSRRLRCSRLLNVVCGVRRPLPHSYHWIYFPEEKFPFFRLVFPSNIMASLAPPDSAIISAEISNPEAGEAGQLAQAVRGQLLKLGMVRQPSDIVFTEQNFLTHAYPVHDQQREAAVSELLDFFKSKDVFSIGRFGAWRYSSIDDAIVGALDAVEEMVESPVAVAI